MLVVSLISVGSTIYKRLWALIFFRNQAGVIVFNFVVVPSEYPGKRRMSRLQVRVSFVKGVAVAVVGKGENFRAIMLAWPPGCGPYS